MNVKLLTHTPNPEHVVAVAARTCYSSNTPSVLWDEMDKASEEKIINRITASGHESPFEHASFTFAIEGVSRSLLAQITRHRLASFSVQSQRYVKTDCVENMVKPPSFVNHAYVGSVDALLLEAQDLYNAMTGDGVPAEDARFILPEGTATNIVVTMNARELLHFFSLRCCNRAQWEIREVADNMLAECYYVAPLLFKNAGSPCVSGRCTEGGMSCGMAEAQREHIKYLKMGCDVKKEVEVNDDMNMIMRVKLDDAAYPLYTAHEEDAGFDLRSPIDIVIPAHGSAVIDTGVHMLIHRGFCGLLVSKSGLNVKNSLTSTGLIDAGYTGSIKVKVYNDSADDYFFARGDKISQVVILIHAKPSLLYVEELPRDTARGDNGFGSSGK